MPGVPASIDTRLTDNSQDALIASFSRLGLRDDDLPPRPDWGTKGQAIKLRCNFFPVKVPKGPLFEYDITINPAVAIKRMKRRLFALAEGSPDWSRAGMTGKVAHDHSSKMISSFPLEQPLVIKIAFTDEDDDQPKKVAKEYTLTIKYVQDLETSSLVRYAPSIDDIHGLPGVEVL